ncbi:MAG: hypothetical protein PVG51_14710 [Desulfosarcina sp.]|jgi:hypothetical protein
MQMLIRTHTELTDNDYRRLANNRAFNAKPTLFLEGLMNGCAYLSKHHGRCVVLIVGIALAVGLGGCLEKYGRFSRDAQVSRAFQSGVVPPELDYYYAGRDSMPYAIMGIDPGYTIPSSLWIAFEPQPEQLRKMSANIYGNDRYDPYGFNMLAPDGAVIGIWFSSLHFPSVTIDQQTRTVEVRYKNPESYREY